MRIPRYRLTGDPTKLRNVTHIWAFHPDYLPGETTPYSGKWLIFVDESKVDALWKILKQAVASKQLGEACKVSSAGMAKRWSAKEYLICVYTPDFRDRADVYRVRTALRENGITWQINYKSSEQYWLMEQGYTTEEINAMHPIGYYFKYRE